MKQHCFLPKSKLGIWSVILFVFSILALVFFFIMVNVFGQRGGETFFSNLTLTIPMLSAWTASTISFVLGLVSTIKSKSESVLVILITAITFLITLYGIGAVL